MTKQKIIIAGTDTDIGKTYISALVMQNLLKDNIPTSSVYIKPIQTGFPEYSDEGFVKEKAKNCNTKTILTYKNPASPHLCAKQENRPINLEELILEIDEICKNYKFSVIELAGGLMVPLSDEFYNLDLVEKLNADKIILVARPNLGTLNHTLLSIKALNSVGIKNHKIEVIINFVEDLSSNDIIEENITFLNKLVKTTVVKYGEKI